LRFKDLLLQAKAGDEKAFGELLIMYRPLLLKESIVDGVFDEDLYTHGYYLVNKRVGEAFKDGLQLK
jgi:hypothetical protein